jgi:hypothetical protein
MPTPGLMDFEGGFTEEANSKATPGVVLAMAREACGVADMAAGREEVVPVAAVSAATVVAAEDMEVGGDFTEHQRLANHDECRLLLPRARDFDKFSPRREL